MSMAAKVDAENPRDIRAYLAQSTRSMNVENTVSVYEKETTALGYSIAEYYDFCKKKY